MSDIRNQQVPELLIVDLHNLHDHIEAQALFLQGFCLFVQAHRSPLSEVRDRVGLAAARGTVGKDGNGLAR